jgi:hypothetical protein
VTGWDVRSADVICVMEPKHEDDPGERTPALRRYALAFGGVGIALLLAGILLAPSRACGSCAAVHGWRRAVGFGGIPSRRTPPRSAVFMALATIHDGSRHWQATGAAPMR